MNDATSPAGAQGPLEAQVRPLEPDGGNLYKPHSLMVNSGQFWRCRHGSTGFGAGLRWDGCAECEKDDPSAFEAWNVAA